MDKQQNLKVIYDLASIPEGCNIDNLFNIMKNGGIVIWDSQLGGKEPKLIDSEELTIYDVGFLTKEMFEEKFNNIIKD